MAKVFSCDTHHILYQKRHWQQGYAHALREYWYVKVLIPRETLHRIIHSKIHDVPTPNGRECRLAFEHLIRLENVGLITEEDTPEERIQHLIDVWEETCPATVAILKWQQEIFRKFYGR